MTTTRCAAAPPDDASSCEGALDAVWVAGTSGLAVETLACERHAAEMIARDVPRLLVLEGPGGTDAVRRVEERVRELLLRDD